MKYMNAVIIDDEADARENLENLLAKYCKNVKVSGAAESAAAGMEVIREKKPDIVFLDIQMPDGSGLDLLESVSDISFEIIFVTAFDEYAIKAIKFAALDYLLKPVNILELKAAVEKAESVVKDKRSKERFNVLLNNQQQLPRKIALRTFEGMIFVKVNDIIRCEASDSYTIFFLNEGDKIMVSGSLKEYDNLLSDHNFFRVHQSHLINLEYIKKYVKGVGGHLVMNDDSIVNISRSKKQEFLDRMTEFNGM